MEDLFVRDTGKYGKGVFLGKGSRRGGILLRFTGPILDFDEIQAESYEDKMAIQVGERKYIGSSGEVDDFVNHSCDPNSGLQLIDGGLFLVAIRNIDGGEEITFDYSTSMNENYTEMDCYCGSASCRGRIRDFKFLPHELKEKYIQLEIVPEYIK